MARGAGLRSYTKGMMDTEVKGNRINILCCNYIINKDDTSNALTFMIIGECS
jgi:hypothetical protein